MAAAPRALTPDRVLAAAIEQAYGRRCRRLKSFVRLYKLPADQRNAHAQFNLGVLWEQGRGGLSKDDRQAAPLPARRQLAHQSRQTLAGVWQF